MSSRSQSPELNRRQPTAASSCPLVEEEGVNPFAEPSRRELSSKFAIDPFHSAGGLLSLRGSIIWTCLPEILTFTLFAVLVCGVNGHKPNTLQLPVTLITLLGTVLGFIISYRTSSAYERYSEGRKLWSAVILGSRTWSRIIWHHIPIDPDAREDEVVRMIIEKKTMINVGTAFSVALKHYLRGEPGIGYKDLYPLVAFLPRYHLPTSNPVDRSDLPTRSSPEISHLGTAPLVDSLKSRRLHRLDPHRPLLPSYNPPPTRYRDVIPFLSLFADLVDLVFRRSQIAKKVPKYARFASGGGKGTPGNLPLEITLILSGYIASLTRRKILDAPTTNQMFGVVSSMSDSLVGLERILYTPLPISYRLHLQHTIYLYLILLPLQLYSIFGWLTIPTTFLISFVFLGFLQIGTEIENPFGYDMNDLDLDSFVHIIESEANEVTAHDPAEMDSMNFSFSDENLPFSFYPAWEGRTASEMVETGTSLAEIRCDLRAAGGKVRSQAATKRLARSVLEGVESSSSSFSHV